LATLDRDRTQRRRRLRPGRENGASAEPENEETKKMTTIFSEPRSKGIDTGRPVTEVRDKPVYRAVVTRLSRPDFAWSWDFWTAAGIRLAFTPDVQRVTG
jgi:hypothetical protein